MLFGMLKGKALQVPIYELFGGKMREDVEVYWSHCATSRVRAYDLVKQPQISNLDDLATFVKEINNSGYKAIKTNILILNEEKPFVHMPGFNGGYNIDRNPELRVMNGFEQTLST